MNHRAPDPSPRLFVSFPGKDSPLAKLETIQQSTSLDFLQQLPDIAWVVDEDGYLVNANPAFYRRFRLESKRALNQLMISLLPTEVSTRLSLQHRAVFNSRQAIKSDVVVQHPGNPAVTYHVHLFPISPVAGRKLVAGIASITTPCPGQRTTMHSTMGELPSGAIINKALQAERTRIGHELHDNVNQILASAALYIDSLQPVNDEQNLIRKKGREYIILAIEEIRNLSRKMVMPYPDNQTLSQKIMRLVQDIRNTTPLRLAYAPDPTPGDFSPAIKLALFRIIQEQVKNILTHSKASEATISIDKTGEAVLLTISDNGIGFDPARVVRGVGLTSMMSRVAQYGGELVVDAEPGNGCRLTASIPLD
ncbi:MAG: PAS domain-containing sensor histidine kinase [Chitinophagaceae bacterium]|nr:MAG: PAS domain-containing sensor histidine kinase [Chitinophagaceae bacterium]